MDIVPTLTYIDRAIVVVRLNIVKLFRLRAYGMDYYMAHVKPLEF